MCVSYADLAKSVTGERGRGGRKKTSEAPRRLEMNGRLFGVAQWDLPSRAVPGTGQAQGPLRAGSSRWEEPREPVQGGSVL